VRKLCDPGTHRNIVSVFNRGKIPGQMIWFLDMERCDLNLEVYILRQWTPRLHRTVPFLTGIDICPTSEKINQVGEIIEDIVKGVGFIHSQQMIHRDLKPRNSIRILSQELTILVLYSRDQNAWQIADFGLTTEGTSQRSYTTHYSRGTSSYRAPELVRNGQFNNKVDIWAVGCILYEIVTHRKAFATDNAVYDYSAQHSFTGAKLTLPLDLEIYQDEKFEDSIGELIYKMLKIDPSIRPSAVDLMCSLRLAFKSEDISESEPEEMAMSMEE
jgi:serine/threonine protein kinase